MYKRNKKIRLSKAHVQGFQENAGFKGKRGKESFHRKDSYKKEVSFRSLNHNNNNNNNNNNYYYYYDYYYYKDVTVF